MSECMNCVALSVALDGSRDEYGSMCRRLDALADALERLFMVHAPPVCRCKDRGGAFCEWCAARKALVLAGRLQ